MTGFAGLDEQIGELYRRVFQSRTIPAKVMDGLGIKHTKGVLLYGPPGSGTPNFAQKKCFGSGCFLNAVFWHVSPHLPFCAVVSVSGPQVYSSIQML